MSLIIQKKKFYKSSYPLFPHILIFKNYPNLSETQIFKITPVSNLMRYTQLSEFNFKKKITRLTSLKLECLRYIITLILFNPSIYRKNVLNYYPIKLK